MKKFLTSFGWARHGFSAVWKEERNFRIESVIAALVIIAAFVREFTPVQWLFLIIAIALVLLAEIINTVVEDICDIVEPNKSPAIGKIKDMMAAYVLGSSIVAAIIGLFIFLAE
jgi:diacylglycerol kinase